MEDKNSKLIAGISGHYNQIGQIALDRRNGDENIPIIGMGHLYTSGGKTTDGDGVRELYVGGAALVNENSFPDYFDYLALGHLHSAQKVGNSENKRYCGSPIPMGFGEANQEKKVLVVELEKKSLSITEHGVPCFQDLKRIAGNAEDIIHEIEKLKSKGSNAWLEIEFTGLVKDAGLNEIVYEAISGTELEILRIKNRRIVEQILTPSTEQETLDDLDERDVFNRCLDANQIEEPERSTLLHAYEEIMKGLYENDNNAE